MKPSIKKAITTTFSQIYSSLQLSLTNFFLWFLALVIISTTGYLLLEILNYLFHTSLILQILSGFTFIFLCLFLYNYYKQLPKYRGEWKINGGIKPPFNTVIAIQSDGIKTDPIDPDCLNWDLNQEIHVVKYRKVII